MIPQIDTIPGAILRVDPAGCIRELNLACQRQDSRLASGASLFDWLESPDREALRRYLESGVSTSDASREFEVRIGPRRYRMVVGGVPRSDGSRLVKITDITEYRALSERVAINEQRYRSLFSQNPDAVFSLDLDGRLLETNRSVEDLTGYPHAELEGLLWEDLIDARYRESVRQCLQAARAGDPCSFIGRITNQSGRRSVVHVTYMPIVVNGQVTGVFAVARDATERYRLEESQRLLQASIAQIQDVIIITETDPLDEPGPRIIFVNEGIERMAGYRPDEVLGETPRLFQGPETDREALHRIRQALEAREPIKETVLNYGKDGKPFWNEIEIVPIAATVHGGKSYFASVQRDITLAKQREAALRSSQEELRRLSRAQESILEQERRRIARDLHDELGQTLTALKLKLGVANSDLPASMSEHARQLQDIINFVDGAVEKVREISANLRPSMLDDLGFEAAAEWFLSKCAEHEKFRVNWNSDPAGDGQVKGDVATALFRILQECMTNISRHSKATQVDIEYRETRTSADLLIVDNGVGFDPAMVGDAGFGLVGIRERVTMLNGKLTVESALGRGVRISVEIPLQEALND